MYSRLARRNERVTKRQSTLLVGASVVILILFVIYGFPAILTLSGTIGSRFGRKATTTEKSLAPMTPRFSQDLEATKLARVTVSGVADSKISVEIFQNERSLGTTLTRDDGTFSLDVDLSRGANIFTAWAITDSGEKSPISDSYIISYLATPPKLEITSPKDGDQLSEPQTILSGKTDTQVTVTVNDHLVVVGSDGNFNYVLNLSSGENKIKIVATDKAGNQTTKEITLKQG